MEKRRVVVTGIGAVSPVGNSAEESWHAVLEGKSGIGPLTRLDSDQFPVKVAAEVKDFDIEEYFQGKMHVKWTALRIMRSLLPLWL